MKFTKKQCGNKNVWDSEREGNEFLRITQNVNGQYVLHHCYGLAENGITPLRTEIKARTNKLNDCKKRARELYEKPVQAVPRAVTADYSHVRLPYAD